MEVVLLIAEIKFSGLSEGDALNILLAAINSGALRRNTRHYSAGELKKAAKPFAESENRWVLSDMLSLFTFTDENGRSNTVTKIDELPREFYPAFANLLKNMGCDI